MFYKATTEIEGGPVEPGLLEEEEEDREQVILIPTGMILQLTHHDEFGMEFVTEFGNSVRISNHHLSALKETPITEAEQRDIENMQKYLEANID